uniref:Putative non-LTR retroelement reverse transcriptase, related n=1 Tax=Medicago truncatula TaxID=3880 RepID=A2Q5K2_MEDTR|nr:Putative non-LTR retroelement reverse transcriptase, related [Medicago truncatula]
MEIQRAREKHGGGKRNSLRRKRKRRRRRKSIIIALHVYALSFFKAPSCIISSIKYLLNNFFWKGCEGHRKISWIGWSSVCLRKEYGGLGVRRLRELNIALLGKWCWRLLVEGDDLWCRVLVARYGVEDGRLEDGGRSCSCWWWEIVRIRDGVEGGYSVRGVYDMLTYQEHAQVPPSMDFIWHKQVPLKVSVFSWRMLDFQQNQNWQLVVSSLQRLGCVWLGAGVWPC